MSFPAKPLAIHLGPSARIRRTPFSDRVEAAGVKGYTVYNHMLLPTMFRSLAEDYEHLRTAVQIWDVAVERQVEITGPDAAKLVQMMTPRDLSKAEDLQCLYIPMTDHDGMMVNDPIAIKLSSDRWWLSIADSDVLLWAKGLAYGMKLNVHCQEPDVSPLAVQGPKSDALMAKLFGEAVTKLKFFRSGWFDFDGHTVLIARSGWSHQGGFEIYLDDASLGHKLWDAVSEAGQEFDIRPGCPNLIERVEAGLVSYGGDAGSKNNPYEFGLAKYCHPERVDCIGREALLKIAANGPDRIIRGLKVHAPMIAACAGGWPLTHKSGHAGTVTAAAMSPRLGAIAMGMVEREFLEPDTMLEITTPDGVFPAKVSLLPM